VCGLIVDSRWLKWIGDKKNGRDNQSIDDQGLDGCQYVSRLGGGGA
jgi:hypothetical protein